ncbi:MULTISPECIES: 5'/3'-nucleotidase SurE [Methylosinus]|uniref:5'-nucleotidase SurE n=1 Tax=Methylosinus trichosporium (strain ATCC 35070 / NCIMB 11131 / UNIQEM 75 / OB3b) TaxID=595536 RepID=A0A2D2CVU9_METT3|nr:MULTISPECIES: 5'/3'-nucleotidase SurE [Methylosinus]ATQ66835.1 5'/3'-nucleotidase SurE [Methylosinus trichosporium OB3b]OBS54293.1 5'/3'-nucleotidase SurE [Methylosinus sp. 3S-1]
MRILITNDDGIHAAGLALAERVARALTDDVFVVAPESEQSGVAHSLSINDPLRLREISSRHFAVKGTPTDCVIMAVRKLLADKPPDLILSGVNSGQNLAEDVSYSGTIAGAIEGTLLGIPSIALSQVYDFFAGRQTIHWACAEAHAAAVIRKLVEAGIPQGVLMNVNFPNCRPEEVRGISITVQGRRSNDLMRIEDRKDGRGIPYYWISFQRGNFTPGPGTDLEAVEGNRISVTPLRLDFTDHPTLTRLSAAFE